MTTSSRPLDADEQKVVDNIRDHGCQVQFVFDADGEKPDFAYSIGLPTSAGEPEVIVFGLRRELMTSMVNEVCRQMIEEGLSLSDGLPISDLVDGFDCIAREITDPQAIKDHFGWAVWYQRSHSKTEMTQAFQLVWPGAQQGVYPWDDGCDTYVIEQQPALYQGTVH